MVEKKKDENKGIGWPFAKFIYDAPDDMFWGIMPRRLDGYRYAIRVHPCFGGYFICEAYKKIEFKPVRHLLILTLCVFVFSAGRSLLDQNIPWQDVIYRATGVFVTSILGFFGFRYIVMKLE